MNDTLIYINTLYHPDDAIRLQGEAELRKLGVAALDALLRVLNGQHTPLRLKRPTGWLGIGQAPKSWRPTPSSARRPCWGGYTIRARPKPCWQLHRTATTRA